MSESGKIIRLRRILNPESGKAVIVAFDHGLLLGAVAGIENPGASLALFRQANVEAVLVTPGTLSRCADVFAGSRMGIVVRVDWTNMWRGEATLGFPEGRGCAVASVEDAVRWGADAVITYMFIGLDDPAAEAEEMRRNAEINRACERFGVVHVIEPMARGTRVRKTNQVELMKLHTRMAAELGADLIKTDLMDNEEETREVVSNSTAPVLFAGGAKADESRILEAVSYSMRGGASGIIFGRNVFQAASPQGFLATVRRLVHGRSEQASV